MALQSVRDTYLDLYLIHYMDDILSAHKDRATLQTILEETVAQLQNWGLKVAPEKIQVSPPYSYLGRILNSETVAYQPLNLRPDHLQTLNDFQKLLGDINWIRPFLKLTTAQLMPLFSILQGDRNPKSPRELTPQAEEALKEVKEAIVNSQLKRINYQEPWSLIILNTCHSPTACLWQKGPLEWLHLPAPPRKVLMSYPLLVASSISKGRKRSKGLLGKEPETVITPYNKHQFETLIYENEDWQIALSNFTGQIEYHLPKDPILQFVNKHEIIFPTLTPLEPLAGAIQVFTDESSNGIAAIVIDPRGKDQYIKQIQTLEKSVRKQNWLP